MPGDKVTQASQSNHLPIVLAMLRQKRSDGELALEQNDGVRRLYWRQAKRPASSSATT
jgi:hypothetical protein